MLIPDWLYIVVYTTFITITIVRGIRRLYFRLTFGRWYVDDPTWRGLNRTFSDSLYQMRLRRYLMAALAGDLSCGRPPVQVDMCGGRLIELIGLSALDFAYMAWQHDYGSGSHTWWPQDRDTVTSRARERINIMLSLYQGEVIFRPNEDGTFELLEGCDAVLRHADESFHAHTKIWFFVTASGAPSPAFVSRVLAVGHKLTVASLSQHRSAMGLQKMPSIDLDLVGFPLVWPRGG